MKDKSCLVSTPLYFYLCNAYLFYILLITIINNRIIKMDIHDEFKSFFNSYAGSSLFLISYFFKL